MDLKQYFGVFCEKRMLLSLGIACGIFIAGFLLFNVIDVPINPKEKSTTKNFVYFLKEKDSSKNEKLVQLAMLKDTKPLFLPTEWNCQMISPLDRMEESVFKAFKPELLLSKDSLYRQVTPPNLITTAKEILNMEAMNAFNGLGQRPPKLTPPCSHPSFLTIEGIDQPGLKLDIAITSDSIPATNQLLLKAAEFLVIVEEFGQFANPLLTSSTGDEAIDTALKNYLSTEMSYPNLPTGYYKFTLSL